MPDDIVLELPLPLSVNKTRKIDWANHRKSTAWLRQADAYFLMQKQKLAPPILGRFEITIMLREGCQRDADNCAKSAIDAIRRFRLVTDDDPSHMRKVTIQFGKVDGCRVTIRAVE